MKITLYLCILIASHWAFSSGHPTTPQTQKQAMESRLNSVHQQLRAFDSFAGEKRSLGSWEIAKPQAEIDNLLFQKMNADKVPINSLCDDATFIRRTSLILTGKLPDPTKTRSFLADSNPNKRAAYIEEVLQSEDYQTYWAFWLQEYFQSVGQLLVGGLDAHNEYLANIVVDDRPFTQMAHEMITATGDNTEEGQANFKVRSTEGARYPLDIYDNIAMRASSKFLGISIECISCHDGAYHLEDINLYLAEKTRKDFWGMSAYFAGTRFRVTRDEEGRPESVTLTNARTSGYTAESTNGDRPIRSGGLIEPAYIFDGDAELVNSDYLDTIAKKITEDRQFARHWANLLWAHVFGLGLVEPLDGFDPYRLDPNRALPEGWTQQALDIDLLEHVTDLFVSGEFKLSNYLRHLLNTSAFQMDSTFAPGKWQDQYAPYYTRYLARRLPAESVYDNISVATGVATPITVRTRQSVRTVTSAHELPDPGQPRGARQFPVFEFLTAFGRGNRFDTIRTNEGGITQALQLMNSSVVNDRLVTENSRIAAYASQNLPTETLINEIFLDTLCRQPSEAEIQQLVAEITSFDSDIERASSLVWLLINRVEFTFIY